MIAVKESKKIKPNRTNNSARKGKWDKFDKPIPRPKTALEDEISKHRGLSRQDFGVNVIL